MATELCGTSFATAYSTTVVHPATSAIHAQVTGVVIPFRTLKSKQAFSMSQGPMWQLAPPYPATHFVHVHDPAIPPTTPPLTQ